MENSIIIGLVILISIIIFLLRKNNQIEKMTETSNINEQIKEQINKIYKANVQSIRNLAEISEKLQEGTLSIPGNLTVDGDLVTKGTTTNEGDLVTKGTITNTGTLINERNVVTKGNTTIKGTLTNEDNLIINKNLTINGNTINNGNLTTKGNTLVDGRLLRNKVRYIQVGNTKSTVGWDKHWSISQLEAFDETGKNVAFRKPVESIKGQYLPNRPPASITDGIIQATEHGQYYHGKYGKSLLEIDLGKEYYIKNIVLTSRWSGEHSESQNGTHIETFNSKRESINLVHLGSSWQDLTKHIEF